MKSKIKSFFKGVLVVFLAIIVIFMVLLFFGEDKSGDYNEIADLIKGEKIEQAENLLNKSSYSKMDYSDEDGKKKMELYRKLYTKEKKYDEAADVVIAYLKANNMDIKAENTDSADGVELYDLVWNVSDIYNKLSAEKQKEVMNLMGESLQKKVNSEGREQREANLAKNEEFEKVEYYINNESVEDAKKMLEESSFSKIGYKESTDEAVISGGILKMRLYKDLYIKQEMYDDAVDVMLTFVKENEGNHKNDQSVSAFIADIYDKLSDEKKNEAMGLMGDTLTTELNRRKAE
jgi:ribosomal protein L22